MARRDQARHDTPKPPRPQLSVLFKSSLFGGCCKGNGYSTEKGLSQSSRHATCCTNSGNAAKNTAASAESSHCATSSSTDLAGGIEEAMMMVAGLGTTTRPRVLLRGATSVEAFQGVNRTGRRVGPKSWERSGGQPCRLCTCWGGGGQLCSLLS